MHISKIILPLPCIDYVYKRLREAGSEGVECVALWAGNIKADTFEVKNSIIPAQTAYKIEMGLLYSVDGEELHRINEWLYRNKMTLISQIHSHPGEAYHSDADDRFPIVAVVGGLSIVIPDFAFGEISLSNWAVFRLFPQKGWLQLKEADVSSLIQIVK